MWVMGNGLAANRQTQRPPSYPGPANASSTHRGSRAFFPPENHYSPRHKESRSREESNLPHRDFNLPHPGQLERRISSRPTAPPQSVSRYWYLLNYSKLLSNEIIIQTDWFTITNRVACLWMVARVEWYVGMGVQTIIINLYLFLVQTIDQQILIITSELGSLRLEVK